MTIVYYKGRKRPPREVHREQSPERERAMLKFRNNKPAATKPVEVGLRTVRKHLRSVDPAQRVERLIELARNHGPEHLERAIADTKRKLADLEAALIWYRALKTHEQDAVLPDAASEVSPR